MGSALVDSTSHRSKILRKKKKKKNPRKFQQAKFQFTMGQQLLISIYIVSGIRSNSDDLKYLGSYMELIYKKLCHFI